MDAAAFRWVLVIIAVVLAVAIYFFGQHQARLRKRNAMDTFTREEIDSAFIEDEQLRFELNNLNQILRENEADENFDEIQINPGADAPTTPFALPDPEIFVPPAIAGKDDDRIISYHLRHDDFRLITGEEASEAARQAGLVINEEGHLEYREEEELAFQVANLVEPGDFWRLEELEFSTLGFNCYIDLDVCPNPRLGYEAMLKKIDELVRTLSVKVYKPGQELLTISDVTDVRQRLAAAAD